MILIWLHSTCSSSVAACTVHVLTCGVYWVHVARYLYALRSSSSLYKKIDTARVQCLNESEEGAGRSVFKPWEDRLDREKVHVHTDLMPVVTSIGVRVSHKGGSPEISSSPQNFQISTLKASH